MTENLLKPGFALLGIAAIVCAVFVAIARPVAQTNANNLLTNPGFEGGWVQDTLYWTPGGGPYTGTFTEIRGPDGWIVWFREGFDCAFCGGGPCTFQTGRPEVLLFTDPARVHSGNQAVKAFTFYRCHEMGLLQQVPVEAGRYVFTIAAHAWYTNCSSKPFDVPLGPDCKTPLAARDYLKVGIDPTGGIDPHGAGVVWGGVVEQYGVYGVQPLTVVADVPADGTITVFTSSLADTPLKHADVYIDNSILFFANHRAWLPFVIR